MADLKDPNPYGKQGRHHKLNQQHTAARYHLRAGIARVALEAKVTGKPAEDSVGRPMLYSNEMAQRHSASQLEKWADDRRSSTAVFSGMEFRCPQCKRSTKQCRCRR